MSIWLGAKVRPLDQTEFAEITYEVMRCVFQVHHELGRLFDEKIYQRELAFRLPNARIEVPLEVAFEDFSKTYYLDLLISDGAIFELKTVERLSSRHRGQLLNYLLLAEAEHGKLVNFRAERVEHEFVNSRLTRAERTAFNVEDSRWREGETVGLKKRMISVLRDWGAALDIALYEEVGTHLCARGQQPYSEVEVCIGGRNLGMQQIRLAAPSVGLRITARPPEDMLTVESSLARLLEHTTLRAIQWINITPRLVQFTTVERREG